MEKIQISMETNIFILNLENGCEKIIMVALIF